MRSKPAAKKEDSQACSPLVFENFLVWTPSGFRAPDSPLPAIPRQEATVEFYGQSAGIRAKGPSEVMALLKKGLAISAFDRLYKAMGLTILELGSIANISLRTLRRRKHDGKLTPEESERVYRIACVFDKAVDVFGDVKIAREWLKEPLIALSGKTPLEYLAMEVGAREVESLLGRIEHGVFS
jgi:putative toxin-antitoxin system antitoxin component (TIGR02293 family)